MKEMESFKMSDVNVLLAYLNSSKNTAELAVQTAKKMLASIGLSKGEKKDELDKLIKELEEQLEAMDDTMEIEIESTLMAEGLDDFMELLDDDLSVEQFVQSKQEYGEQKSAAGRTLGIISAILMLLGIVAVAYGYVIYLRGGIAGDPTAQNVFIRIGVNSAAVRTSVMSQSWFSPRKRKMPLSFSCPAIPAIRSAMKTFLRMRGLYHYSAAYLL